jgi:ribonuclease VapC
VNEVVFDASALMALLREEPGGKTVEGYLNRAIISTVNLSEVIAKLIKHGMPEKVAIDIVSSLGLRIVDFDQDMAYRTAALITVTLKAGLSLGDRACLAMAQKLKLPAITADKTWGKLDLSCDIKLVR